MLDAVLATVPVSAVIVTRNRPHIIGGAVASVLANDFPCFDLTVVDQSGGNDTAEVLRPIAEADGRLHYFHVDQVGVSRACNTAIRNSSGEILAFTDDDCRVPADWLRSIVGIFAADAAAEMIFGNVLAPLGPRRAGITPQMRVVTPERMTWDSRLRYGCKLFGGMGANFAARRRLLDRIGGFDEVLGPGAPLVSGQDFDLAYRAICAGAVVLRRPDVQVVHQYGTRPVDEWPARLRDYALGDAALYCKHVRAGDTFALLLLARWLTHQVGRPAIKALVRGAPFSLQYLTSFYRGARRSFQFAVDPKTRMYLTP